MDEKWMEGTRKRKWKRSKDRNSERKKKIGNKWSGREKMEKNKQTKMRREREREKQMEWTE